MVKAALATTVRQDFKGRGELDKVQRCSGFARERAVGIPVFPLPESSVADHGIGIPEKRSPGMSGVGQQSRARIIHFQKRIPEGAADGGLARAARPREND